MLKRNSGIELLPLQLCTQSTMSDNPLQHLLQAFGKVSECVQSHISQFLLRPGVSSPLLSKNQSPLVSHSSHYADSHRQPAKILVESSSPTTKEELGTATWTFLHTLAAQYPDKPNRQQKKDVKELIAILSRMYPCKECADHFKEVISANPVQAGSHHEFSQWLCHVHNVVNRSLGKLVFPCERVDARWGKLECEKRACDLQGTSMGFDDELK